MQERLPNGHKLERAPRGSISILENFRVYSYLQYIYYYHKRTISILILIKLIIQLLNCDNWPDKLSFVNPEIIILKVINLKNTPQDKKKKI